MSTTTPIWTTNPPGGAAAGQNLGSGLVATVYTGKNPGILSGSIWGKFAALPQKKRFLNETTILICR